MEKSIQIQLGTRIRELRTEKVGLSQERFALKIGMDRTYYSSIERGAHSPTIAILERVNEGLGVTFEELFKGM